MQEFCVCLNAYLYIYFSVKKGILRTVSLFFVIRNWTSIFCAFFFFYKLLTVLIQKFFVMGVEEGLAYSFSCHHGSDHGRNFNYKSVLSINLLRLYYWKLV